MSLRRERFIACGQVQGVGFRPFVFNLAGEYGLTGFVRNSPRGVVIEAQGPATALDRFAHALENRLPPLARLTSLDRETRAALDGETSFLIAQSTAGSTHAVLISPDTATCADCLADMRTPGGRRYRYPFTNCTNCGPRYTITRSIPYDRAATSMACFPLCPDCRAEYENPRDRRFHAQPNACPACGPRVWRVRSLSLPPPGNAPGNREAATAGAPPQAAGAASQDFRSTVPPSGAPLSDAVPQGDAALAALAEFLFSGGIAAFKGLGGFHLACDACDDAAVSRLRKRKNRPHKPFALMAPDLGEIRRFARVGTAEEELLLSAERPIVLCPLSEQGKVLLAPGVSPDTRAVGVMLPYTPLHFVLFEHLRESAQDDARLLALVMTSGNPGGEPICLGNREAAAHLGGMAEAFLFHDRDILIRADDSVVRPLPGGGVLFLRRARGYVPWPIPLPEFRPGPDATGKADEASAPCVLGVGAELKNTLCLTKGEDAFVSQHIGDMANLETAAFHAGMREHLAGLLKVEPAAVIRDLHPDYLSSGLAEALGKERGIPVLRLQHHFAHAHAVLAEHRFSGKALVFALDGTGLGEDGALWGGELLFVHTRPGELPLHERVACFAPLDLPGGEKAIREPWRIAHALLLRLGLADAAPLPPWLPEHASTAALLPAMLARRVNTPLSTSCGRLFDAVAALLGLCNATTYEGQAAVRLEEAQHADGSGAREDNAPLYPCPFAPARSGMTAALELDTHALFAAVHADLARGMPVPAIARRFHRSLAVSLADLAAHVAAQRDVRQVGLSGGCLQNSTLAAGLARELEQRGLTPLSHQQLPPGDGCISLGQAAWGRMVFSVVKKTT